MGEYVIGEVRIAYIFLVRNTEEKRSLGKPKVKLEYTTIMEMREAGNENVDCIQLV
jgi:hypothetical protein